jgi:ADP-heptose:LPS heptosyltransferase
MKELPEARKVLVMELAGLGDNVHLLPALWLVRRRWPDADLHVMVNAHVASLFKLTPWVNRIWPYPSQPKPGLRDNLRWASDLRHEKYEVVINTTGSDRSSLITWATRAPRRFGRRPSDGGPPGWRLLYTDVVEQPFYREPMFRQKWRCLAQAGFRRGRRTGIPRRHRSGAAPRRGHRGGRRRHLFPRESVYYCG